MALASAKPETYENALSVYKEKLKSVGIDKTHEQYAYVKNARTYLDKILTALEAQNFIIWEENQVTWRV